MALAPMRIGILSDTHVPDVLPVLPARVFDVFKGVDIILHAGDVCKLDVLQQLEPLAQTFAVYGERDDTRVQKYLQDRQRLDFAQRSIGLVHGHQAWQGSTWTRWLYRWNEERRINSLTDYVLREFALDQVDAVVFGHSHTPYIKMHGSVLLFNPGSATPHQGQPGTAGILEIGANAIKGRIVTL